MDLNVAVSAHTPIKARYLRFRFSSYTPRFANARKMMRRSSRLKMIESQATHKHIQTRQLMGCQFTNIKRWCVSHTLTIAFTFQSQSLRSSPDWRLRSPMHRQHRLSYHASYFFAFRFRVPISLPLCPIFGPFIND